MRGKLAIFLAGACLFAGQASAAPAPTPVKLAAGLVQGSVDADGIASYKGIPFAAPPVGQLRWRAPQPAAAWAGVRPANTFAPACAQDVDANARNTAPPQPTSEDCLYLNVWVPPHAAGAKLPVMVWIYGGGFLYGSSANPSTWGEGLAKNGVILVSIAHRVGPFGFLAHPLLTAESGGKGSGNYALLDMVAALQWVHDNIGSFGGDPGNVTLFGESSGAAAVNILASSPLTKGLIQRVIAQSGGSFAPPRRSREVQEGGHLLMPLDFAEDKGVAYFKTLGVSTLAEARALPADQLIKATGSVLSGQFWAVIDHHVLHGDQYTLYQQGRFNDVPILIGSNADEGAPFVPVPAAAANYEADLRAAFGSFADDILAVLPAGDAKRNVRSARDLRRDSTFGWSSWTWARMKTAYGKTPAYLYHFDQQPPWPAGPQEDWGAAHAIEIPYVFGTLDTRPMKWTADDRKLSERMMRYWTNFARTGDPNGPGLPQWPVFSPDKPTTMYLNANPATGPVANLPALTVFDRYYEDRRRKEAEINAGKK